MRKKYICLAEEMHAIEHLDKKGNKNKFWVWEKTNKKSGSMKESIFIRGIIPPDCDHKTLVRQGVNEAVNVKL